MTSLVSGAERPPSGCPRAAGAALAIPSSRFERFKNSNTSGATGELLLSRSHDFVMAMGVVQLVMASPLPGAACSVRWDVGIAATS